MFKIIGITDSINTCDCCGKKNLKCAVELEYEDGSSVWFGRDCAAKAVYGNKQRANVSSVELAAQVAQKCREVLPSVLNMIASGMDMTQVKKELQKVHFEYSVAFGVYTDTGNKMPLRIYWKSSKAGVEIKPEYY